MLPDRSLNFVFRCSLLIIAMFVLAGDLAEAQSTADKTGASISTSIENFVSKSQLNCPAIKLSVVKNYPISGYWVLGEYSVCDWMSLLEKIHQLGADTVIQFGGRLTPVTTSNLNTDQVFSKCKENGVDCSLQAKYDLSSISSKHTIRRVYSLRLPTIGSEAFIVCPAFDRRIETADFVFWRLLIPVGGKSTDGCDVEPRTSFDLVIIASRKNDSISTLLSQASSFGMHVFVGMPMAAQDIIRPWEVDKEAISTILAISDRFFRDMDNRFKKFKSFEGFYQSFEIAITENPVQSALDLYTQQHKLAMDILPGKKIMISPYWDSRRSRSNAAVSVQSVRVGVTKIIDTGVDVVAPQDGGGTGKVGRFTVKDRQKRIEPELRNLFGQVNYEDAYLASTEDYYRAAREAIDSYNTLMNRKISLWANIEAFDPEPSFPCGSEVKRSRTTKARLEIGIRLAKPHVSKIISYMWNPFFICKGGASNSLSEEILY